VSGTVNRVANVKGGSGADVLEGDENDNALVGNGGNDILVGNQGADHLTGAAGFTILIGGDGADQLDGGLGTSLMIGGRTRWDANTSALLSLLAEWGRTDVNQATKMGHLRGTLSGGRNGATTLVASGANQSVLADRAARDVFKDSAAGAGPDWIWYLAADSIIDLRRAGDVLQLLS